MKVETQWLIEYYNEQLNHATNGYEIDYFRDILDKLRNGYEMVWIKPNEKKLTLKELKELRGGPTSLLGDNLQVIIEDGKFVLGAKE